MFLYSIFRSINLNSYDEKVNNRFLFSRKKKFQTNTSAPSNLIKPFIVDNETFEHEEERLAKASRLDGKEVDINSLKRDLGKCPLIWSYPVNQ